MIHRLSLKSTIQPLQIKILTIKGLAKGKEKPKRGENGSYLERKRNVGGNKRFKNATQSQKIEENRAKEIENLAKSS
jgi:hypothetical protein